MVSMHDSSFVVFSPRKILCWREGLTHWERKIQTQSRRVRNEAGYKSKGGLGIVLAINKNFT